MSEKLLPPAFSEDRECFGLQGDRDLARRFVTLLAPFQQRDAMGPLVPLMRLAFHQSRLFHALQQRGHGVGIAAHALRQFPLCQPARLAFQQRAHHGELIRRDLQVRNAAAKRLVQAEPGPAQQRGQATALGRIDGQRVSVTGTLLCLRHETEAFTERSRMEQVLWRCAVAGGLSR